VKKHGLIIHRCSIKGLLTNCEEKGGKSANSPYSELERGRMNEVVRDGGGHRSARGAGSRGELAWDYVERASGVLRNTELGKKTCTLT